MVVLRPQLDGDLILLPGGDSSFDDFGPRRRSVPLPSGLEEAGGFTVTADDVVIGEVSWIWTRWGPNQGSCCPMFGIWLRPDARGRGLGTAAQAELVGHFFRHTTANRVQAHTDVANHAEQGALERAGLRAEGVTRGAQWRAGGYHDAVLYAVTRDDWTAASRS